MLPKAAQLGINVTLLEKGILGKISDVPKVFRYHEDMASPKPVCSLR